MSASKKQLARFRVGDWVSFLFGARRALAQIIEDRGRLGVDYRRLYRVRLELSSAEPMEFEMPEDDLEAASAPKIKVGERAN